MSLFPLDRLLARLITHGETTVTSTGDDRRTFGNTDGAGPSVTIRINDPRLVRSVLRRPALLIGEGYMDGSYSLESGTLRDLLEILIVSFRRA